MLIGINQIGQITQLPTDCVCEFVIPHLGIFNAFKHARLLTD